MKFFNSVLCIAVAITGAHSVPGGYASWQEQQQPSQSLFDALGPDYSIFKQLVQRSNLLESLQNSTQLPPPPEVPTIFAPNNQAFKSLSQPVVDFLQSDFVPPIFIRSLLDYHIVPQNISTAVITANLTRYPTLAQPFEVVVYQNGSQFQVNQARIVLADVFTQNATVQGIDAVLSPFFLLTPAAGGGANMPQISLPDQISIPLKQIVDGLGGLLLPQPQPQS
jgi:uncharacterized surface protein with fasciclin (FAS1) repeats